MYLNFNVKFNHLNGKVMLHSKVQMKKHIQIKTHSKNLKLCKIIDLLKTIIQ